MTTTENSELNAAFEVVMEYTLRENEEPLTETERETMIAQFERLRKLMFDDAAQKINSIRFNTSEDTPQKIYTDEDSDSA